MSLKPYVEIPCDDIDNISQGIYQHIVNKTQLLVDPLIEGQAWYWLDAKQLLLDVPELLEFYKNLGLVPRHAAVTIITADGQLPKHIDEPPVVAKINIPVTNTTGWTNRWYDGDTVIAELQDMKLPVVFNSQILHSVEQTSSDIVVPRIVASFTFYNEPVDLLK